MLKRKALTSVNKFHVDFKKKINKTHEDGNFIHMYHSEVET